VRLFDKQKEYLKDFKNKDILYSYYGGGVGGGKSVVQLLIAHLMAIDYPKSRHAVIRKNRTTLTRTSVRSYQKILDIFEDRAFIKFNKVDLIAEYPNGSTIEFIEADITKDPELNKLRGLELTTAVIEEANEIPEQVFSILKTRVGRQNRFIINNEEIILPPKIQLNSNPAKNWVKDQFYDPWSIGIIKPPFSFQEALPHDNPHNTKEYLESLETLPDNEKQRFVYGNWEFVSDPNQLILYEWVKSCLIEDDDIFNRLIDERTSKYDIALGVDVAREGDDRSVLAYFVGNKLCRFEVFRIPDTAKLADVIKLRMDEYEIHPKKVAIDIIGPGGGTFDSLKKLGHTVVPYSSSYAVEQKPNDIYNFKNLRAKEHWGFREDIRLGNIEIINHKDFIKEAVNINYHVPDDAKDLKIEGKQAIKTRLKYSPDLLDAAVIGNHVRKNILTGIGITGLGKRLASASDPYHSG
jgi:hypothetical protein